MKTIPLSQGYVALVDDADYERVSAFKWSARVKPGRHFTRVYAWRHMRINGKRVSTSLHYFITGIKGIDHADNDGLNNQRDNLRPANAGQNNANSRRPRTSGYRGVFKNNSKWRVRIGKDGVYHHIATCADEVDAATVYNFAAEELHGEFAIFNTPHSSPQPEM